MAWFPAPDRLDPRVAECLHFERDWLSGDWTGRKVLVTGLVPLSLTAYCLAFWRRSPGWGLVLLNAMAVGKVLWGVVPGRGTGRAMLAPAGAGLLVGDVVLFVVARSRRRRPATGSAVASAAERAGQQGSRAPWPGAGCSVQPRREGQSHDEPLG